MRAVAAALGAALLVGCERGTPPPSVVDVGAHPAPSLVAVAPSAAAPRVGRGAIAFELDPGRAEARARREDRPLLVLATAEWSVASAELGRALEQPDVAAAARAAVALRLDLTDTDATAELAERYRITSVPTLLVLTARGEERLRLEGLPLDRPALLRALDADGEP